MKVLRWFVDIWIRLSNWYATRREATERYEARIEHLTRTHRLEVLELREMLVIKDKQIKILALAHEQHRSIIAADMALNARTAADAAEGQRGN